MSEEQPGEPVERAGGDESGDGRRRREDRRSLIDLTRAERGEPERRRLPGVERRSPDDHPDGAPGA
ncbi:hypothetical protein FHR75_003426 [Kineococcus radiotolerans]|uniref:Uncharacterized protein n=1 Tax=Kineococcus radiotolerans TaxID=131568 RepID=A0A7W4XYT9_KINRA|nr:hypothetical protein [Kineococcus radiotolerans]MBB2902595.1 hypothetical protein [Kineococcus radiotolerans]